MIKLFFKYIFSMFLFSYVFSSDLIVDKIVSGLYKPIFIVSPINNNETLFIAQQNGVIKLYINGELSKIDVLDIRDKVHQPKMPADERGLLGLALDPNFIKNGYLFVNYVNSEDYSIISRFNVDLNTYYSNPKSEKVILKVKQPYSNHNGGHLTFGPDDKLYIGFGDGGYAGDPHKHGQNLNTVFGSILRLEIDESGELIIPKDNPFINSTESKDEIWCFGLRNPWRFSFDRLNGDLYIADVGQNNWEEINYMPYSQAGSSNFGWNYMEGSNCYPFPSDCDSLKYIKPIFEYPNNANYIKTLIGWKQHSAQGCSVTGGYVYRGKIINNLYGLYLFGDYCTGKIWTFQVNNGEMENYKEWTIKGIDEALYITSFSEDSLGEIYILNHTGTVYKIIDAKN